MYLYRWSVWFVRSAVLLLSLTALAKIISAFGSAAVLQKDDPVMGISIQMTLCLASALEFAVCGVCLFAQRVGHKLVLLAWLTTTFVAYRVALVCSGYEGHCNCLGNITDSLHISPDMADLTMKIVLGYLLVGSYLTSFWVFKEHGVAGLTHFLSKDFRGQFALVGRADQEEQNGR